MKYQLEKYKGQQSRFDCPACGGKRTFALYVNIETGDRVHHTCGRCNREDNCSYHLTPRDYFAANGITPAFDTYHERRESEPLKQPSFIDASTMMATLRAYESNVFVQWLISLFGPELVTKAIERYYIGTATRGRVIFWQIDRYNRIRTGKIMSYETDGHRSKKFHPTWVHSAKRDGKAVYPDYTLKQCLFGEHLASLDKQATIAVTESEKTAIIASIYLPKYIWMACGSKNGVSVDKLQSLKGRKVVLYPDLNGYSDWSRKAKEAEALLTGTSIRVSDLLEKNATDAERNEGLDLADFLLREPLSPVKPTQPSLKEFLGGIACQIAPNTPANIGGIEVTCLRRSMDEIIEGYEATIGREENIKWQNHIRAIYDLFELPHEGKN